MVKTEEKNNNNKVYTSAMATSGITNISINKYTNSSDLLDYYTDNVKYQKVYVGLCVCV